MVLKRKGNLIKEEILRKILRKGLRKDLRKKEENLLKEKIKEDKLFL